MPTLFSRKSGSSLALAIALATGTSMVATAVFPADASAQRSKRDRDRDRDRGEKEQSAGTYSDAFKEAYFPLQEALSAEGANVAALRPQIDALVPLLQSSDEQIAGGGLVFNAGINSQDRELQLRGMELMLASGQVQPENTGRYNFIAYQLANEMSDFDKARRYLQASIDNNFTSDTVRASDLRIAMAESYFKENQLGQGLTYLQDAIASQRALGQPVDEQWYRRGVTVAYENEVTPQVYDFATMWLDEYPSATNWRDAINLTRNLNTFEASEILDLFRLSRRVDALTDASDYDYYVEAADPRRLPQEVKDVIEAGMAKGVVSNSNSFIAEALETAGSRIASDRQDLPALERDAMAAGAELRTVAAAGSAFLSYGEYDKAARFYERALEMPGVDRNEALTRLGIAHIGLGDYAAAREALGQVTGKREPIAKLWSTYADQLETGNGAAIGAAAISAAPELTPS